MKKTMTSTRFLEVVSQFAVELDERENNFFEYPHSLISKLNMDFNSDNALIYLCDYLEGLDTYKLKIIIENVFEENEYGSDLEIILFLCINANYLIQQDKKQYLNFFAYVYGLLQTNDIICKVYAEEILLHNIDFENLREEYPEYPELYIEDTTDYNIKVSIPISELADYIKANPTATIESITSTTEYK